MDKAWRKIPNVTRVQVDVINGTFPPPQISVYEPGKPFFQFDRRLKPEDGWVKAAPKDAKKPPKKSENDENG
ncbi:MAG: hypothetical protein R3F11_05230 [Verrucomicrobiales bacterium]